MVAMGDDEAWFPPVTNGDGLCPLGDVPVILLIPLPGVVRVFPTDPGATGVPGLLPGTDNLEITKTNF